MTGTPADEDYIHARSMAELKIRRARKLASGPLTPEAIRDQVSEVLRQEPELAKTVNAERLARELETIFTVWIGSPVSLDDAGEHVPWLHAKAGKLSWRYWGRYEAYLRQQGWANEAIRSVSDVSFQTLDRLEDPSRDGSWDIRGMVVGHVQSGKTANYTGLIARAVDAGYKVIVVLAGMHNSLRSQTQARLDEGLLGYDSTKNLARGGRKPIGVGEIIPLEGIDTITTRQDNGDFRTDVARNFGVSPGGHTILFVVKKNATVLKNILEWVDFSSRGYREDGRPCVRDIPLLVIDDEADFGSVDTKDIPKDEDGQPDREHDPTVLNGLIRKLLYWFQKKAYIGYTATPFANIYIHDLGNTREEGDDLFPRNFITMLEAPSNYLGPAEVFGVAADPERGEEGRPGLPIVHSIDDADEWIPSKHKKTHVPKIEGAEDIPASLRKAIREFVLVCAARMARGHSAAFNTMLVHVTRFVAVQDRVYRQVAEYLDTIQKRLKYGDGERRPAIREALREMWQDDFIKTSEAMRGTSGQPPLPWEEIDRHLVDAACAVQVKQINGTAKDALDYIEHRGKGLSVIAVGGDRLSRGLTLEGLSVSYFLRASRMYDTLMQMGRWFGYRPGYEDLCRLHLTSELKDNFIHITSANEELREVFNDMAISGGKPRDYGIRVKSHDSLLVTAPVKMREGTDLLLSFSGEIVETVVFHQEEKVVKANNDVLDLLMSRCSEDGKVPVVTSSAEGVGGARKWEGVPGGRIVEFLKGIKTHPEARKVRTELLAGYVEKQLEKGWLGEWTVLLASGSSVPPYSGYSCGPINLIVRDWHEEYRKPEAQKKLGRYVIRRLVSPADERVDLTAEERDRALELTRKDWKLKKERGLGRIAKEEPVSPSGPAIRRIRSRTKGLLMIYPLDPTGKTEAGANGMPVVGFAISFPQNFDEVKVEYVVNRIYSEQGLHE